MDRLITVKAKAKVSVKVDLVIINMILESHKLDYDEMMELATNSVDKITSAIESVGFDKKDLKTTSFNVRTHYENYRDEENNYKSKFDGYVCEQGLNLEFDFDSNLMSKVLTAITNTNANPKLNIQFSIKDKVGVNEELLIQATKNAKSTAKILAESSNVDLGKLVKIDYNLDQLNLYSPTMYDVEKRAMVKEMSFSPTIEPEDINVSDTVTFIWEIK